MHQKRYSEVLAVIPSWLFCKCPALQIADRLLQTLKGSRGNAAHPWEALTSMQREALLWQAMKLKFSLSVLTA